jgi:hypothetical protein
MVGLMNSNFVSLSKVSDDTVVEKILDEWFVKKINLFCILEEAVKSAGYQDAFLLSTYRRRAGNN